MYSGFYNILKGKQFVPLKWEEKCEHLIYFESRILPWEWYLKKGTDLVSSLIGKAMK